MPLRERISDFLSRLIPGQPPHPPQPAAISPPSDASSDQSSGGNALLPIDSSTTPSQALLQSPESPSSNAAESHTTTNRLRPVRSLTRQTIPRLGLGMRRFGDDKSMITKDRDTSSLADEQRLFPSYKQRSPGGVTIKPGQAAVKPKKPQNLGGFRPVNTLSGRARDSGPVRAQGKQNNRVNKQRGFGSGTFHSDGAVDFESSERPLKRQRRESLDGPVGRTISISDDDIMEQAAPEISSPTGNSASGHRSGKGKKSRKMNQVDKYREGEQNMRIPRESSSKNHTRWSVDDGREEQFTEDAANERRLSASKTDKPVGVVKPRKSRHEILQSVEIHGVNGTQENSTPKDDVEVRPNRAYDLRESPDELQGEATVRPAPTVLSRGGRRHPNDDSERDEPPTSSGRQQLSPSNIRPTNFTSASSSISKKKPTTKSKPKNTHNKGQVFKLTYLRLGTELRHPKDETMDLIIDVEDGVISFNGCANPCPLLALKRVNKVEITDDANRKMRLGLTRTEGTGGQLDIELSEVDEKRNFCALLLNSTGAKIVSRESEYMDKVFSHRSKRLSDQQLHGDKKILESGRRQESPERVTNPPISKRKKLSDALQNEDGNTAGQKPAETASSPREEVECTSSNTHPNGIKTYTLPHKYKSLFSPPVRATRSMSRRAPPPTVVCDDEDEELAPQPISNGKQNRWHRPLIYPRFGKKKAEVNAQDLERLGDNEFLNDNLIGFYIRFLQDHLERCNKEAAKRVYFFNSYFFATLTNWPRGKRAINYEGVQKWTRNVDIFSHDYVVVPINENAHWYVAIICNLPYLPGVSNVTAEEDKPSEGEVPAAQPDSEVQEVQETPEPGQNNDAQPGKEEIARQSLESMNLSDETASRELGSQELGSQGPTESVSTEANTDTKAEASQEGDSKRTGPGVTGSPQKPRKQKKKPTGPKHDIRQPIIITFDSLNLARSPTISILRDYLHAEAKSKRDVDIDKGMIKGMRAQEIPLQANYSDCGLYLLAYLEKFVQNPDQFVWKLLRKEMSTREDWPEVKSGLLRSRLRKFLDRLYDEQAQLNPENASERKIMADMQPVSYLLTSPFVLWRDPGPAHRSNEPPPPQSKGSTNDDAIPKDSGSSKPTARSSVQQSSTSAEQPQDEAPEPRTDGTPEHSEKKGEIIEVPDSQEPIQAIPASPLRKTTRQKEKENQMRPAEPEEVVVSQEKQGIAQNEGDGSAEKASETDISVKAQPFEVEVQVRRTPPPSTTDKPPVKKSPRKRKHKLAKAT